LELIYDLTPISPADVRAVELWITADGGQSWRKIASDDDRCSPVAAKVDADGTYGFRLLVHRQGGPVELPPGAGQPPELVVEVDQTEPKCHLTRVDQVGTAIRTGPAAPRLSGPAIPTGSQPSHGGDLVISWAASDRHLAQRPVTLRWSHSPTGPWRTIAQGLENTGSYTWPMPERLPAEVFLRLEVRDAADNVGQFTAERAITPQLPTPQGRLRAVQPLSPGPTTFRRVEPRTYLFR
jgi:hypothetical protein